MGENELVIYMIFFFLLLLLFFWFGVSSGNKGQRMSSNIKQCRDCVFCVPGGDASVDPKDESTWHYAMCHHEESRVNDSSGIGWHLGREYMKPSGDYKTCSRMRRTLCGRTARYHRHREHANNPLYKVYYYLREGIRLS